LHIPSFPLEIQTFTVGRQAIGLARKMLHRHGLVFLARKLLSGGLAVETPQNHSVRNTRPFRLTKIQQNRPL